MVQGARCGEIRTAGSASGRGKRTGAVQAPRHRPTPRPGTLPLTPVDQHDVWLGRSDAAWRINDGSLSGGSPTGQAGGRTGEEKPMAVRDIYLKIEPIRDYSPVEPDDHVSPPIKYRRDCMRNMGHEDGVIPPAEVAARRLTALIYREYLDPQYLVPRPDKLVAADVNEPAFTRRVPGTVIYTKPGDWLRIHV